MSNRQFFNIVVLKSRKMIIRFLSFQIVKKGIFEMANRQFSNIENLSFDDMAGRLWAGEAAVFAI